MRHRILFGAVLALGSVIALAACGGSSSETPPPLQPDPAGFRYASTPPTPIAEESDAGDAPSSPRSTPAATTAEPRARVPARSTWGSAPAPH
ncbi:MAG TPA: hypothetical protein VGJ91_15260 [Polyangiaceae bacterium]|jgi:hypothetical protein